MVPAHTGGPGVRGARDGFHLIEASTAGEEDAILELLATLQPRVRIYDILLTHGHDDHTGSAAALAERTGARVIAPRDEAAVISGEQEAAHPVLADWEIPLFAAVTPDVPPRRRSLRIGSWPTATGSAGSTTQWSWRPPGTPRVTSRRGSTATGSSSPATR